MQNLQENKIYIIFSSTPLKIGKFIRFVTSNKYNHVSISLDSSLQTMYSFCRYYKSTPLYGGFVKEYSSRHKNKDKLSNIKVCEIILNDKKYHCIKEYLNSMENSQDKYIYNLFSAMFVPFRKRIFIPYSFTCVEFVVNTFSKIDDKIIKDKFYSIQDLEKHFNSNVIYEGPIKIDNINNDDCFLETKSIFYNLYHTISSFKKLTYRLITRSKKRSSV